MEIEIEPGGYIGPPTQGMPGKWLISHIIGEGGMGSVYEAETVGIKRRVAIKVAPTTSGDHLARFKREVKNLGRLEHPNIVGIIDAGEQVQGKSRMAYMVMERLSGHDFEAELEAHRDLLRSGQTWSMSRSLMENCAIMGRLAHALAAAHRLEIVHRDVKPSNLFLARQPDGSIVPKLIDFGIARLMAVTRRTTKLTQDGAVLGTPQYMPPEQCRGDENLGPKADQFSFACVLYEIITGVVPYNPPDADNINVVKLMHDRLQAMKLGPDMWIELLPDWVPDDLKAMLRVALEPDPDKRFNDMFDMCLILYAQGGLPKPEEPSSFNPISELTEVLVLEVSTSNPGTPRSDVQPAKATGKETLAPTTTQNDLSAVGMPRRVMLGAGSAAAALVAIVLIAAQVLRSTPPRSRPDAATARPMPSALVVTHDASLPSTDAAISSDVTNVVANAQLSEDAGTTALVIADAGSSEPVQPTRRGRDRRAHRRTETPEQRQARDIRRRLMQQCCNGTGVPSAVDADRCPPAPGSSDYRRLRCGHH